jgi:hypothetical protein
MYPKKNILATYIGFIFKMPNFFGDNTPAASQALYL